MNRCPCCGRLRRAARAIVTRLCSVCTQGKCPDCRGTEPTAREAYALFLAPRLLAHQARVAAEMDRLGLSRRPGRRT